MFKIIKYINNNIARHYIQLHYHTYMFDFCVSTCIGYKKFPNLPKTLNVNLDCRSQVVNTHTFKQNVFIFDQCLWQ